MDGHGGWLGTVTARSSCDPPVPALAGLVGEPISKGLRQRADALAAEHRDGATVLHQLLDDLPMAALISGYGSSREVPDFTMPPEAGGGDDRPVLRLAGGGTMLGRPRDHGPVPDPARPGRPAPRADAGDPLCLARRCRRAAPPLDPSRRRRPASTSGRRTPASLEVDVHFRDSHLGPGDGSRTCCTSTGWRSRSTRSTLVVRSATATARVLPWPECPGALGQRGAIVGEPVTGLRPLVAMRFTGTSTCTHLNDSLRSLAGVQSLLAALR